MDSKGNIHQVPEGKKPPGGSIPLMPHEVRYLEKFPAEEKGFELAWYRYKHNFLLKKNPKITPFEVNKLRLCMRFGYFFHSYVITGVMPGQLGGGQEVPKEPIPSKA